MSDQNDKPLAGWNNKGRKPAIYTVSVEKMIEVYSKMKSIRRASVALGISTFTLQKYLKLAKFKPELRTRPVNYSWVPDDKSKFGKWLREKKPTLPRSIKSIALLSGFPYDEVISYLRKRKRAVTAYVAALGDLRDLGGISLVDIKGRRIAAGMFNQYEVVIDQYNLSITINAVLNFGGRAVFKLSFPKYRDLFEQKCPPKEAE